MSEILPKGLRSFIDAIKASLVKDSCLAWDTPRILPNALDGFEDMFFYL